MKFDNGIKYTKAPITLECSLNDARNIINSLDCSLKAKFDIRTGIEFVKKPMFRLCEMQFACTLEVNAVRIQPVLGDTLI